MPSIPILDSHVHFWDPQRLPLPWLAGLPELHRPFLPGDFETARGEVELAGLVFVECDVAPGRHLEEAEFADRLARSEPLLAAMIPHAPLEKGLDAAADLRRLAAFPRVRGVRRLLQQEPDPKFCLRPAFLDGVRLLAEFDLHFEITVYHHQMESVIGLVERCPEVRFVLDHCGKPAIREGRFEPWASHIRALAEAPNLVCKLSGLVTEADHRNWREDQIRPYMDHVLERFGSERVMFGGDWPVVTLAASYLRWVGLVDRVLGGARPEEQEAVWRNTAARIYRLDQATG